MNKKRAICFLCKAKKFTIFLNYTFSGTPTKGRHWICKNKEKCFLRGANYQK